MPAGSSLLLLGDLLNTLDYASMTGILIDIFGIDDVRTVTTLRMTGREEEARQVIAQRSEGRRDEIRTEFTRLAYQQYEEIFAALSGPTFLILGNVDIPPLAATFAAQHPSCVHADGEVHEIEGQRIGFVGGALPTPLRVAGEVSPETIRDRIAGLGEVDVLCTHIPPAVPELCFDTVAGKSERGSEDILEYILQVQPERHYFGHVHQPLISSMYVGRTLCINVGHFRATERAFPHRP